MQAVLVSKNPVPERDAQCYQRIGLFLHEIDVQSIIKPIMVLVLSQMVLC